MVVQKLMTDDTLGPVSRRQALKLSTACLGTAALAGCSIFDGEKLEELNEELSTPLIDPESVEWSTGISYDGQLEPEKQDGHMMVGIESHPMGIFEPRLYGVWHENVQHAHFDAEFDWEVRWDLARGEFESENEDFQDEGYRLLDQAHYLRADDDENRRRAGIWIENPGNLDWDAAWDLSASECSAQADVCEEEGLMPIGVETYARSAAGDDGTYYALTMVENADDLDWKQDMGLERTEFSATLKQRRAEGYRLVDLSARQYGGNEQFAAVWIENIDRKPFQGPQSEPDGKSYDGHKWEVSLDLSLLEYEEKKREMFDRGYRPISQTVYMSDAPLSSMDVYYAVVWRQNSMRPDWSHRRKTDNTLVDHMNTYNLPSITAAIIEDGVYVYRRGFGERSVSQGKPADSRTRYRLASVSKAVGGILGFQLQEDPDVDLDLSDKTRRHLSGEFPDDCPDTGFGADPPDDPGYPHMPCRHTHSLRDLLSHRACISHYGDLDYVPSTSEYERYTSAYEAVTDYFNGGEAADTRFWDVPLLTTEPDDDDIEYGTDVQGAEYAACFPGISYRYSSHGFALLGAAYEAAVSTKPIPNLDTSIADIIENRLSTPYGLDSLQAENRGDGSDHRARLYEYEGEVDVMVQATGEEDGDVDYFIHFSGENVELKEGTPSGDKSEYVDSNSWSVLGAGIESHVADLARLGWLLIDDDLDDPVISEQSRDEMWDPVDTDVEDNYALGWRASSSAWHSGSQTGGNSTLRVYPDDDIVIAIFSNRQSEISGSDFDQDFNDSVWSVRNDLYSMIS